MTKRCPKGSRKKNNKCIKKETVPETYLPKSLSNKDYEKQKRELKKSRKLYKNKQYITRKKIASFQSTTSPHVIRAMKMYNVDKINSSSALAKATKCSREGLEKIISKGRGAYHSSGSRPNQTAESWGRARLASAISGGNASITDYHVLNEHCKSNSKALKLAEELIKKKGKKIKVDKKAQLGGRKNTNNQIKCGSKKVTPKELNFKGYPDFKPNLTPEQIFSLGSFGGTYFRPIHSSITNKDYKNQHKEFKWLKNFPDECLTNDWKNYNKDLNKYKVSCGLTLEAWENSGWITEKDPYGWVQWYCRFFDGRRDKTEDERQINRWKKFASKDSGRFRKNLVTKILKANTNYNDESISPVIRQGLQHWGYQLTKKDFDYEKENRK